MVSFRQFQRHLEFQYGGLKPETILLKTNSRDQPAYLGSYERVGLNSNGYPYIFGVQHPKAHVHDTTAYNRKSKMQDGDRQTGSTCISACGHDINKIPSARPMFLGSDNPKGLTKIQYNLTGSVKSKMTATKPEVLISPPVEMTYSLTA